MNYTAAQMNLHERSLNKSVRDVSVGFRDWLSRPLDTKPGAVGSVALFHATGDMCKPALEQGTCSYWPQGNVSKTACGPDKKRGGMVGKKKNKAQGRGGRATRGPATELARRRLPDLA